MIETLEITNFKSVKHLTLPCKRFNVFIGEPNTGKSNILEALGLLSFIGAWKYQPGIKLGGFVRHERLSHLFYDEQVEGSFSIKWDRLGLFMGYHSGIYDGRCEDSCPDDANEEPDRVADWVAFDETIDTVNTYAQGVQMFQGHCVLPSEVRFYRSPATDQFRPSSCGYLLPPYGSNLIDLLASNRELGQRVSLPFSNEGLKLWLRPHENKIDVARNFDDMVITSFPYSMVSETLQRSTFYTAVLKTNRNSVIVLEEPEAHSFPEHTGHLAERIALEENSNQYFITTHNPYFLMSLLEKAENGQLAINIVYSEDHQTKVKEISPSDLPELFELDVFANLERYLYP